MLTNNSLGLNHISLGPNYFVKRWLKKSNMPDRPTENEENDVYIIYNIKNSSFPYFIGNLLSMVCKNLDDRDWFLFPIEGGKESYRYKVIKILPT